ncbi:MAG: hypothetical protein EAZ85_03040 [Bacteroidetes bacterium]|nr:MAG: hypothetical protein EAZ85_03040 [Bacteroidota bacterium]
MKNENKTQKLVTILVIIIFLNVIFLSCSKKDETPNDNNVIKGVSTQDKLKILEKEIVVVDSILSVEEKKSSEKDTLLIDRLKKIQSLKLELDGAIRNGNKNLQETLALKIQHKLQENKQEEKIKILNDSIVKIMANNPKSTDQSSETQNQYQELKNKNTELLAKIEILEKQLEKIKGKIIVKSFTIQGVEKDGKTIPKTLNAIDHFKVIFETNHIIEPSKIYYEVKYNNTSFDIVKSSDGKKIIPVSTKKIKKGDYLFIMKYDGEIIAKTIITLKPRIN